jgi:hypothetical protein
VELRNCIRKKLWVYVVISRWVAGTRESEMGDSRTCSGLGALTGCSRGFSKGAARARATCTTQRTPYSEWVQSPCYYYNHCNDSLYLWNRGSDWVEEQLQTLRRSFTYCSRLEQNSAEKADSVVSSSSTAYTVQCRVRLCEWCNFAN